MNSDFFVESLVKFTEAFLRNNPTDPDYINLQQYASVEHNTFLIKQYEMLLSHTSGDVIDIGSGVGFAKVVRPSVRTSNVGANFFVAFEQLMDIECDYRSFDCLYTDDWVRADTLFDYAILHRFMPWSGQTLDARTKSHMFTGVNRVLKDSGVLIYTPISITGLDTSRWEKIDTRTYKITKAQIYDEISSSANKIL